MPSQTLIWHVGDLVIASVILILLRRGLAQQYRAWWFFLIFQLFRDIAVATIPFDSLLYARFYLASELAGDFVLVVALYEWFRLLTAHYLGIKLAGTWFLNFGLGASFLVCLATVGPDWRGIDWTAPVFYLVLLARHVIVGVLSVSIALAFLAFLAYRVRVRPNVIWHGLLLMCYLWLQSALAIADATSHFSTLHVTNTFRQIAVPVLYGGWAVLLTRHGEEVEIAARLTDAERVQLDRLNEELLTLARRTMRRI